MYSCSWLIAARLIKSIIGSAGHKREVMWPGPNPENRFFKLHGREMSILLRISCPCRIHIIQSNEIVKQAEVNSQNQYVILTISFHSSFLCSSAKWFGNCFNIILFWEFILRCNLMLRVSTYWTLKGQYKGRA